MVGKRAATWATTPGSAPELALEPFSRVFRSQSWPGRDSREASSFTTWITQLTRTESEAAVDWTEHEQFVQLFHDSFTTPLTADGQPEEIEQVLCRDDEAGLLLFTHTRTANRTLEVTRVSLPAGVDLTWLSVEPRRPAPVGTFQLHLQGLMQDFLQATHRLHLTQTPLRLLWTTAHQPA